jgi:3-phenylpropionate/trans-cinnamate dioxygenase ferredoxin component
MTEPTPPDESERDLLVEIERLIAELQGDHGPVVRARVEQLLQDVDAIHRAGLTHLMDAIRGMGGDAFVNRLIADTAIRMLLMSYDLVPIDRRLMAEESIDAVRGHLHARGIDIEITEVVGGVVYVRLHGVQPGSGAEKAVVHDLEEALHASFIGFQELVTRGREQKVTTIPLSGLRRANEPVYAEAARLSALPDPGLTPVEAGGHSILLVRADGEVFALGNRCGTSPLPLEFSTLEGATLVCSWHGCRYDVRTGKPEGLGDTVRVFPVRLEDDRVLVAVAVEPASKEIA